MTEEEFQQAYVFEILAHGKQRLSMDDTDYMGQLVETYEDWKARYAFFNDIGFDNTVDPDYN
jgi:hypothetical protein